MTERTISEEDMAAAIKSAMDAYFAYRPWLLRTEEQEKTFAEAFARGVDCGLEVKAPQEGAESYPPLPKPAFRLFWDGARGCYKVSAPNIDDVQVYTETELHAYADATVALRARGAVPSGWKLVPVALSSDMQHAAVINDLHPHRLEAIWQYLLATSPAAPMSAKQD